MSPTSAISAPAGIWPVSEADGVVVDWIVVMGARVRADGQPSQTLKRRTARAAELALLHSEARILATGGRRASSHPEAEVAARLLTERGIDPARVERDDDSWDTLASVLYVAAHIRRRGGSEIVVCTDDFHAPRCWLLFRMHGLAPRVAPAAGARSQLGLLRWLWYCCREVLATIWDVAILLSSRIRAREPGGA